MDKFYITTAIAYTSRKPHIGNTYEAILTDVIARYNRLLGKDVFFLTGTDEHGQKIEEYAKAAGVTPKAYVDKVAGEIREILDLMNTSYDKFIRTTDEYHVKTVQKIFKKLYDQGDIYKSEYEGMYCVPCESFFTPSQLKDGKCPDCGREVQPTKEEAYFLRMSKYQDRLMQYLDEHPDFIQPESRKREMVNNFLKPGLQDLCVSRTSFQWGIPVTFDDKHVIYVWVDALSNYITALGYDPDGSGELFENYWPCDAHIIGKDILRFHTIYWPIILMALGIELPKKIFGHPWLLFANQKMSKSTGNVMYADDLVRRFGVDAVRYYVLSEMPFAQDGTITYETIIERYNSDLANTLGNLVNRTVAMVNKYFGGTVRKPSQSCEVDEDLKKVALETVRTCTQRMEDFRVADALESVLTLAKRSNKYIDETAPWVLAKNPEDAQRLNAVMYNLIESIRFIAVLLQAFLPDTAESFLDQIGADVSARSYASLESFGATSDGQSMGEAKVLFNRIDAPKMLKEIEAEIAAQQKAEEKKNANQKPQVEKEAPEGVVIGIDDFDKVELRVARIRECCKVEKSDKLLKLQLDDGDGGRQVVSGIAAWYTPEQLIGKNVIVVANLKPAKLRGVESQGMILAADRPNGDVRVIFVDDEIESGSRIR